MRRVSSGTNPVEAAVAPLTPLRAQPLPNSTPTDAEPWRAFSGAPRPRVEARTGGAAPPQLRARVELSRRPTEVSAERAAALIQPGDRVFLPIGVAVPGAVLDALRARAGTMGGGLSADAPVELVTLSNHADPAIFDPAGKVVPRTLFVGSSTRAALAEGRGGHVPVHLSRVPELIRDGTIPVDVALIAVSPPDAQGFVSVGPSVASVMAAVETARLVIAEVNPSIPRTRGESRIHQGRIHFTVAAEAPLHAPPVSEPTAVDHAIAAHVLTLIPEEPTLQFGIGAIPDAIAAALARSGRRDLRVHSELIADGVKALVESGAVQGTVTYSFAQGSEALLRWLQTEPSLDIQPTDRVNDPLLNAKIPRLVAVNSALKVDLSGQVNAQYVGGRWYSGVGGQVDFFRAAMASPGGRAILALPSTSTIDRGHGRERVSRVVPRLGEDDSITTSMYDLQYVVTEHGVAALEGKTTEERARALIAIADPEFRSALTEDLEAQLTQRRLRSWPGAVEQLITAPGAAEALARAAAELRGGPAILDSRDLFSERLGAALAEAAPGPALPAELQGPAEAYARWLAAGLSTRGEVTPTSIRVERGPPAPRRGWTATVTLVGPAEEFGARVAPRGSTVLADGPLGAPGVPDDRVRLVISFEGPHTRARRGRVPSAG